jgi:hypothetical protein
LVSRAFAPSSIGAKNTPDNRRSTYCSHKSSACFFR